SGPRYIARPFFLFKCRICLFPRCRRTVSLTAPQGISKLRKVKKMKKFKKTISSARSWKAALVAIAIAGWLSIPLLHNMAEAGGVPILVRTASLTSPTGSINPHGDSEYQLYANGHREIEVEIEDVNLPAGTA